MAGLRTLRLPHSAAQAGHARCGLPVICTCQPGSGGSSGCSNSLAGGNLGCLRGSLPASRQLPDRGHASGS